MRTTKGFTFTLLCHAFEFQNEILMVDSYLDDKSRDMKMILNCILKLGQNRSQGRLLP